METTPQPASTPWYKKWWVILIGVLLVIGTIGNLFGLGSKDNADEPADNTTALVQPTATPTATPDAPEPTEEPADETTQVTCADPAALTTALLEYEGAPTWADINADSPGSWITSIETQGCQWVRVNTDRPLDDDGIHQLAVYMYGPGCMVYPTPYSVIVTVNGIDHNMNDADLKAICQANRP